MASPLPFHPAVSAWFASRFPAPTSAQLAAWQATSQHKNALIAAPTGSGKTLAAFLSAINDLVVEGLERGLTDEVHVLYVSPLKALSNDIQKNLQEPLVGIRDKLLEHGLPDVSIRDAVRTGDTSQAERQLMRKTPPHILVTTPESLFILLTSDSGRAMLSHVRSVIIDELHAVAGTKRGAHLMLSLERLEALTGKAPIRIGLSATQKPIEDMAKFLIGGRDTPVEIIDTGHTRKRDLALELPKAPLDAVMANEVWGEIYDRLAELVREHRTTLIFVGQRRLAERATKHLAERIGEEHVACHHGSLSKEHRLQAEQRLKAGKLRALIATSSLELGIDIGDIDLVCNLGSPRTIAAFLQRVGRAGHAVSAIPKGRLFPLSLDELVESAALLDSVRRGELDRIHISDKPLDVLAQHIVAEVGSREWDVEELFALVKRAQNYRDLDRKTFEQVLQMLGEGFTTRRGRRSAHLHYDAINGKLRPRKGARLTAVTNAGVIPDQFDYDVVLSPEEHRIGSIGEDFSFEAIPGDIFQLGNHSYRIIKVEVGKVFVADAHGQPPTLPFWFGEAPARSNELSASVSRLRETFIEKSESGEAINDWLQGEIGLPAAGALQLRQYLAASKNAFGILPMLDTIVLERFFDEAGDTHLVIHSPYGSRINRAWGLALRKRFCRSFNFELQASAVEDSIILSLGPTHSFPLCDIQHYLKSATARDILIQALLDAPMFGTRWRWNGAVALALKRMRNGKRIAPQLQRMDAEDLLAVVFPDQLACQENIVGDREIPDHPLVKQTIDDCLHEVMDVDGFLDLLKRNEAGQINFVACDLTEPSPMSASIISAKPYAFLDDGDAEERRTRAIKSRSLADPLAAGDIGKIDPAAIRQVREEAWPEAGSADEMHDALVVSGFLTESEAAHWRSWFEALRADRRAVLIDRGEPLWVAAERQPQFDPLQGANLVEIVRSRLELLGPVTAAELGKPLGFDAGEIDIALLALEAEGAVMRGNFTAGNEWCERRLLHRMHRYTRDRQRSEIQPVAPAHFMRFLLRWQQVGRGEERREGEQGLLAALRQLEGFAAAAGAWEGDLLPARMTNYGSHMLDRLVVSGRIAWTRSGSRAATDAPRKSGPVRMTPILWSERDTAAHWRETVEGEEIALSSRGARVQESLKAHGASFLDDLVHDTGLLRTDVELSLGELVAAGLVTADSFAGLRGLLMNSARRARLKERGLGVDEAGRWSLVRKLRRAEAGAGALAEPHVEHIARVLLRRYGVVFRKLLERESNLPPWRELFYVYRRLEARGEIRGGRFVNGFAGEQFALTEAATLLRKVSKETPGDELVAISAADPLNLVGVIVPGERVPAVSGNRVLLRNGVPAAVQIGRDVQVLQKLEPRAEWEIRNLLIRRARPGSYLDMPNAHQ
jgi:ATP-dependent Lhr-like helicase